MEISVGELLITDNPNRIDRTLVHSWITESYWAKGITFERFDRAVRHSAITVCAMRDGNQVGFCRVVTDFVRFAWLCDVIVDPTARGGGIGKAVVEFALGHPDMADVDRWMLGTFDAHRLYERYGFAPLEDPKRWMIRRRSDTPAGEH